MLNSNPLTPKSDKHLISVDNITPESNVKATRKEGNYHKLKKLLIVKQFLLISTLSEQCEEYAY